MNLLFKDGLGINRLELGLEVPSGVGARVASTARVG